MREARPGHRDPLAILGSALKLWLRADAGITITGAGVSQWADQSGNGNHAVQGTDALRPIYSTVAGASAVDTDATRYMTIPDHASLRMVNGQAFGVIAVFRSADTGVTRGPIGKATNSASGIEWCLNVNNSTHAQPSFWGLGAAGNKNQPIADYDLTVGEDVYATGRLTVAQAVQTGANGGWGAALALGGAVVTGTAQVTLGRYAFNAGGFVASLREFIIWQRPTDLTAAEERALMASCRPRWPIP